MVAHARLSQFISMGVLNAASPASNLRWKRELQDEMVKQETAELKSRAASSVVSLNNPENAEAHVNGATSCP